LKVSIDGLTSYSFCPRYLELEGPSLLKSRLDGSGVIRSLVTFVFRKELETSEKVSSTVIKNKWTKIFWAKYPEEHDESHALFRRHKSSLRGFLLWYARHPGRVLALNFSLQGEMDGAYPHLVTGLLPAIFEHDDGAVSLFFLHENFYPEDLLKSPAIKYLGAILHSQGFSVKTIINFGGVHRKPFRIQELYPDGSFWEGSSRELVGLLDSMQAGVSYTNFAGCSKCLIADRCRKTKV